MNYGLLLFLLSIFLASLALPQSATTPKSGNPSKKTATTKTITKKASTPKSATGKASAKTSTKKGRSSSSKKPVQTAASTATWRSRQVAPTPERYREIQQALADKGYLKSEPNGVWDEQSIDAMRQFQTDRKLPPTGKISSASLIGLGLGPKNNPPETPAQPPAAVPESDPQPWSP